MEIVTSDANARVIADVVWRMLVFVCQLWVVLVVINEVLFRLADLKRVLSLAFGVAVLQGKV
jgi:hypothetical protein